MLAAGLIGVFVTTCSSCGRGRRLSGRDRRGAGWPPRWSFLGGGTAAGALRRARAQNAGRSAPGRERVEAPCAQRGGRRTRRLRERPWIDHLVPLDEVLDAHREVSERMARELRCTALGGLSVTPTSKAIEAKLADAGGCGACDS